MLQRIDARRLEDALGRLSETQREAVVLSHLAGDSHAEIAELLGVALGTVESRFRKGLHALRAAIERRAPRAEPVGGSLTAVARMPCVLAPAAASMIHHR